LRLSVFIAGLFPVFLAVGATSSILEMTPPICGLSLANLRDMFEEVHNGHPHEAIDIAEPRGTPVLAVASGIVRKLFLSKPGGNTIYQFDEMEEYCYYYAHLDGYVEGLREGMRVQRGDVIGFVGSTGNADPRTPHLHFAIFKLGPERLWWKGKAVNPYPGLAAAVKRGSVAKAECAGYASNWKPSPIARTAYRPRPPAAVREPGASRSTSTQ
jgi:murein DD-endopeptidase MepM/ murein hydrolase activator NlpD